SKTLRFDFPRVPVIGTIILIITLINIPEYVDHLCDINGKISIGVLTISTISLGVLGLLVAELFSLAGVKSLSALNKFEKFLILKRTKEDKSSIRTGSQWFLQTQEVLSPAPRKQERIPGQKIEDRPTLHQLSPNQIHATLHALEMEC